MNRTLKLVFLLTALLFYYAGSGQNIKVYQTFEEFEPLLHKENDTIYVVNFWATWCMPCVKEIPEFMEINEKFKNKKFKMILVSLDFESKLESTVKPFVRDRNIEAEIVLLADSKQHKWIDRVNLNWGGSIPATVIYNKDFYIFREETMTFDELNTIITKNIIE